MWWFIIIMKIAILLIALVAVAAAENAHYTIPMTLENRVTEQVGWKALEYVSGFLVNLRDHPHYTSPMKLYNLAQLGVYSSWYESNIYQIVRSFVGCESGISNGVNTVFTVIDIGQSDGWTWQTVLFAGVYLYAWYQQNLGALQYYCTEFISLI